MKNLILLFLFLVIVSSTIKSQINIYQQNNIIITTPPQTGNDIPINNSNISTLDNAINNYNNSNINLGSLPPKSQYNESALRNASLYNDRGQSKANLQDYNGAIADYTMAIELNPVFLSAYMNRGSAKYHQKDYKGAIVDYTTAIENDPYPAGAYCSRGIAELMLKDNRACIDLRKASELGDEDAPRLLKKYCTISH